MFTDMPDDVRAVIVTVCKLGMVLSGVNLFIALTEVAIGADPTDGDE